VAAGLAAGLNVSSERRAADRLPPHHTPWRELALLRPGQEVVVINLSCGGALVESDGRMSPGARAELQLFGDARRLVRGRVTRCHVMRLDPIRYQGAIVFDERLEIDVGRTEGSTPSA
jgi:hypothetical protein